MTDTDPRDRRLKDLLVQQGIADEGEVGRLAEEAVEGTLSLRASMIKALVKDGKVTRGHAQELLQEAEATVYRGDRLGHYVLEDKLGEGGMGAVFRAQDTALRRTVAIKILPLRLAQNEQFVERFKREARSAASLDHPNVVRGIDIGFEGGRHYMVMELVEGETFASLIEREGALPEEKVLDVGAQMAAALVHATEHQLIHRDIKPENILMTQEGVAKLADLGLARHVDEDATRLTQTGAVMGTPLYISPEQATGDKELDIRTDIYSLGATLFHALAGEVPFKASSAAAVMAARLKGDPPGVRDVSPTVSRGTEGIIAGMMALKPEDRYAHPSEVLKDMELVSKGHSPAHVRVGGLLAWLGFGGIRRERRRKIVKALAAGVLLGLAVLVTFIAASVLSGGDTEGARAQAQMEQFDRLLASAKEEEAKGGLAAALKLYEGAEEITETEEVTAALARTRRMVALNAAKEAMKAEALAKARSELAKARAISPGEDADELASEIDRCGVWREALARASLGLEREEFDAAREALASLGGCSVEPYASERSDLLAQVDLEQRFKRHLAEGRRLLPQGEIEKAIEQLRSAGKLKPNDEEAAATLAEAEEKQALRRKAEEEARLKAEKERTAEEAARKQRGTLIDSGNAKAADGAFREALALYAQAREFGDDPALVEKTRAARFGLAMRKAAEACGKGELETALDSVVAAAGEADGEDEEEKARGLAEEIKLLEKALACEEVGRLEEAKGLAGGLLSTACAPQAKALLARAACKEKFASALASARQETNVFAWKEVERACTEALDASPGDKEAVALLERARVRLSLPTEFDNPKGMAFVLVRAGLFRIGSAAGDEDEKPVHEVVLDDYYIGKFPVTNSQYELYKPTRALDRKITSSSDDMPVTYVCWVEARDFCTWLSKEEERLYRLPTEAEWERAARGTDVREYPWGKEKPARDLLNFNGDGRARSRWKLDGFEFCSPVGVFGKGASPCGALDMAGNVWEWCADWYSPGYYRESPRAAPTGPAKGTLRIVRGGSWMQGSGAARSANRCAFEPALRDATIGFRVVLEVE